VFGDIRFGLRLLTQSPVFTATVTLLLAIGISANTLMFSVFDALLLRPLPVSHPENLVRLVEVHPHDFITWELPYKLCAAWAARDHNVSEVLCQGDADLAFSDGTSTERVRVHLVSPNFFSSLGVRPYLGRVLTPDEDHTAAPNAVLSYDFWERRFHGDRSVLGRRIILRGHPFTVIGVSPEVFNGLTVDTTPDIRVPASTFHLLTDSQNEGRMFAQIFARLRSGVSLQAANREADPLLRSAYQETGDYMGKLNVITSRLQLESVANGVSTLRTQFSGGLEVLMAAVALLLLMACANVAGLLLSRSTVRSREIAVRLALGASPARIVRQLFTEGLLLALLGGIAGILLTVACLPLLVRGIPPMRDRAAVLQPLAVHIDIDFRVLCFAIAVTLLTAILFALSPALRSAHADVASVLKEGRGSTGRLLSRNLIVVAQVALCTLILIGAALLIETLERMRAMNAGFDRDHVITFTLDPSLRSYKPEQSRAFSKSLLQNAAALPGVSAAGIASRGVMRGTGVKFTVAPAGVRIQRDDFLNSSLNGVTPGYFDTMGIRLLAGRDFNWFDHRAAKPARVIVNQAFAHRFYPGRNPIGQRFGTGSAGDLAKPDDEIVGVVSDAKYRSLREPVPPTVYYPSVDGFDSDFILHLRTPRRPEALIQPVRQILRSLDPELPLIEVRTLRDEVEASLWQERLLALLSAIFGIIATLLAGIGLYGSLDYAVKSRTREIGVRIVLGAQPERIIALLSREVLVVIGAGICLGLIGYAAASAWIHRVLYEVPSWEPVAVISALALIALVALIATIPSTYRAARIDPSSALRIE
jgi:predicted permease